MLEKYKKRYPTPCSVWRNPIHFITFGFGVGAIPFAPGTFGTLATIPLYLIVSQLPLWGYLVFTILFIAVASWLCDKTCREIGVHDHPGTVIDEFVGFIVTMVAAPKGWVWILLGFVLFRIFDIIKPQPIKWLDKNLKGGFGVVFDDVVAGIFALILIQLLALIL